VFWAHAISRLDGSKSDGIHLLWAPPRNAGYSLDGFDIWRRQSRRKRDYDCYTLTADQLTTLHTTLRVQVPGGVIAVRLGAAPAPPGAVPDEAFKPGNPDKRDKNKPDKTSGKRPRKGASEDIHEIIAEAARGAKDAVATWKSVLEDVRSVAARKHLASKEYDALVSRLSRSPASDYTGPRIHDDASLAAAPAGLVPAVSVNPKCLVYEIRYDRPCNGARIRFTPYGGLAVAFRGQKAVEAKAMTLSGTQADVEFHSEGIERVILFVAVMARSLTICCLNPEDRKNWEDAKLIARNLQFPLRTIEPSVHSLAQEQALAKSRLLPGEDLGPGQFKDLSREMNEALTHDKASPAHVASMVRSTTDQDFIEIQPWSTGLALTMSAPWRRALGLGFLDAGHGLVKGDSYDYRIVGRFRRCDVDERLLGFHTLPLGTPLPSVVHLGGLRIDFGGERAVIGQPGIPTTGLAHGFRKGIRLSGKTTLTFAAPLTRVVFECEPDTVSLNYRAGTGGMILGLPLYVSSGTVPAHARAELTFPDPVTRLDLEGDALLYGIRVGLVPPGVDPFERVERDAVIYDVKYESTPPPDAPLVLGTTNLQTAPLVGDPAITTQHPPQLIGFKLHWLPPSPSGTNWPPAWWIPDVPSAPPTDITGFEIERRRVDTGGQWEPFDIDPDTHLGALVGAARSSRKDPQPVRAGDEMLDHFPEVAVPVPPVPVLAELEDVLLSRAKPKGPPPGSLHQYRIRSVDAIGRVSPVPTAGSVVRLEKHLPPPRPPGPPIAAGETRPLPRGVRARLLQAADGSLSDADRARLGTRQNAVLIQWGWTDEERKADTYAREFRVYWQPNPPDLIHGQFSGTANLVGGAYELAATLSHAVTADQFANQFIVAGSYPFKIIGHGAGAAGGPIVFRLQPSSLAINPPPVPQARPFTLSPSLDGTELQPVSWQERSAVVAIDARTEYEFVFPQISTIDAAHPRVRIWAGVSSADDQPYVPDTLPMAATNGGRPGNESSIVPATAEGRWLGRPVLTVPPPLPNVPEIMIAEVAGESVSHQIDLAALLPGVPHPAGSRFLVERLSAADLMARLSAEEDASFRINLPDGGIQPYTLANPGDRTALLAQIRSGEPAQVENRFLMDIAITFNATSLDTIWKPPLPQPVSFAAVTDTVSNKAERYLYRLRAVDAAGHISAGVAFVPRIFRVPSRRLPAVPTLVRLLPDGDAVEAIVRVASSFDLAGVLLFALVEDNAAAAPTRSDKPQLLRVPNRRDLYPNQGIRLRLSDGTLLAPAFAATGTATAAGRLLTWNLDQAAGFNKRVTVWAAAITRDGFASPVTGPLSGATGLAPPAVPALSVNAAGSSDNAMWPAPATDVLLRLERSVDGGATWNAVSPWLPPVTTAHGIAAIADAGRRYRLRARRATEETTGPAVAPA
jgi:hypothetical protein